MRWTNSVVTRLVACLGVGALVLSIVLSNFEYNRALKLVEVSTGQQMVMVARNLQDVLRTLLPRAADRGLEDALAIFNQDPRVMAVRLHVPTGRSITTGRWPANAAELALWSLTDGGADSQGGLELERPTLLVTSFVHAGQSYTVQMVIDGPFIASRMRGQVLEQMANMGVVLGTMMLLGLLLLRRWLIAPLWRVVKLVKQDAPAQVFERHAAESSGEFNALAGSIARMLRRIDETAEQLRDRERAFHHLYQFAPAPMVSIGPDGRISRGNRRAAELLGVDQEEELIGREILAFVVPRDRPLFRQSIDRLEVERLHRCELQIEVLTRRIDLALEFTAVQDEHSNLTSVRLSMTDITESRRLMNQVAEQRRLLDLVVNHMSDAILLVGAGGRIITGNHRLVTLLRRNLEDLPGATHDPAEFWQRLELTHGEVFEQRMRDALSKTAETWSEQFDCRDGAFRFQAIPVLDEVHKPIGHLIVVQEVTAQVRNQRLLEQQSAQLRALQQISRRLHMIDDVEQLLERVVGELYAVFGTEGVGLALRDADPQKRCRQMFWLGEDRIAYPQGHALADAVAQQLMPRVLNAKATSFWSDLAQHDWTAAFTDVGVDAVAATALYSKEQTQGILWIARRGGEHIERHHLFLLEALAPLLSTALENVQLRQHLAQMQLTDAVTGLPSRRLLNTLIARQINRPGYPWSLMVLDIDDFKRLNERYGIPTADRVLRAVADTLRARCRAADHIVRFDKDQFVIISPGMEVHETALKARRLAETIASIDVADDAGSPIGVTCCIGLAGSAGDHASGQLTLEIALQRLIAAKHRGGGAVEAQIGAVEQSA